MEQAKPTYEELQQQLINLHQDLEEANDTIEAIRTGQVDAIIVQGEKGHELYTLKTADQTYRVFIEKMTEGAVTLNKDGIILYSNSRFASMVNHPLSQVIGLPFNQFIASESQEQFAALMHKGWEEDCKDEVTLKSDGKTIVQLSLTTLELDEGFSLSIILTDLTDQKEAQRQLKVKNDELKEINHALELSNHDLQQFASVASHDLQEPLRKIQVFSNLLKNREVDNNFDDPKHYLDKILASADRMKQLIIDVLNYSRLSANKNNFEKTDLNLVISDLLADYEITIQEKNAQVLVDELSCIEVNRGQIRQVFQNILSNALKFCKSDETPVITIKAEQVSSKDFNAATAHNGEYCRISIKDNGIGFDEKYVQNVFSLFERLNSKDEYEGTGIGLAIAKKIIEKHNGLITANSAEGIGSEFIVILPIAQA